jgi:HK97 gp10 family phage protein
MSRSRDLVPFFSDLDRIEKKLRNQILRKALREGAKVLSSEIRMRAPVGPTGDLKHGIKVRAGKGGKNMIVVMVEITTPEGNIHTGFVEFGKVHSPANPFIRRSVIDKEDEIVGKVFDAIESALLN